MKDFLAENGELIYINAINAGLDNRLMRSTNMNETSSRSHLLISLVLKFQEQGTGRSRTGKITFIDLAGSERLALSLAQTPGFMKKPYLLMKVFPTLGSLSNNFQEKLTTGGSVSSKQSSRRCSRTLWAATRRSL